MLATVLENSTPAPWKLLFKALEQSDYQSLLTDHQTCGALVNQNNAHWIALVKHKERRAGSGAAGDRKINNFNENPLKKHRF